MEAVAIDEEALTRFHDYVLEHGYQTPRLGVLLGLVNELDVVEVHAIWEPPQIPSETLGVVEEGAALLSEQPLAEEAASMLGRKETEGLQVVGWILAQSEERSQTEDLLNVWEGLEMGRRQERYGSHFVTVVGRGFSLPRGFFSLPFVRLQLTETPLRAQSWRWRTGTWP